MMKLLLFLTFFIFNDCQNLNLTETFNILVTVPSIAHSHVTFHGHLAEVLAKRGHFVRFAIHEMRPISEIKLKNVQISKISTSVAFLEQKSQKQVLQDVFENGTGYDDETMRKFAESTAKMCRDVITNADYLQLLKNEKFTVGICSEIDPCSLALFKMLKIEAVVLATPMPFSDMHESIFGIPIHRSYSTFMFNGFHTAPNLHFWQRFQHVWSDLKHIFEGNFVMNENQKMLDKLFGKNVFDLHELFRNVDLMITNGHELVDISRPTIHKIVKIGGLAVKKPQKLNSEIEEIVKKSKKGIVLFTFGGQVDLSELPKNLKLNLFNALSRFPEIEFLLKYDRNQSGFHDVIDDYKNLHPFPWLDQTSILANPKTLAFITHGGRNSLAEAITFGVPTLSVPLFADQHYNSAVYKNRGIGISLEVTELEETAVVHALKRVIFDSKIRENSRLLKDKLASYPFPGNQKFISWIEFVAKFKHFPEFDLHSTKMNFFQLHNLDVYMTILSGILIFAIFFVIIFKQTLSFLTNFIKNEPKIKIN